MKNLNKMSKEEKQELAKEIANSILKNETIDLNEKGNIEILEAEASNIVANSNVLTVNSMSSLTRRGDMNKQALKKLEEITDVAQSTSKTFKRKTFFGIPIPFISKNRLSKLSLKLKDAHELIANVSDDLDGFEHTLRGDIVTLGQNSAELKGYSAQMGEHIELAHMIVLELTKSQDKENLLDKKDFAYKINQVNRRIEIKEKKRTIINTAILQLNKQKKEAYNIVENVKDSKEIIPLMMAVSALIAAGSDTQISIQNTLNSLTAKANEMFIENIDNQMQLSNKVKEFNVADTDKEVLSKINTFITHIDKNKKELLTSKTDIENKIKELSELNSKLSDAIDFTEEIRNKEIEGE